MCQACLSEHASSAVQSTYPHVLVQCPAVVFVLGEVEGKITTEKKCIETYVDHEVSIFLY